MSLRQYHLIALTPDTYPTIFFYDGRPAGDTVATIATVNYFAKSIVKHGSQVNVAGTDGIGAFQVSIDLNGNVSLIALSNNTQPVGIQTINGDSSAAQLISAGTGLQVATSAGNTNMSVDPAIVALITNVNQTIAGIKIFSSSPQVPTPVNNTDAANKQYADTKVSAISVNTTGGLLIAVGRGSDGGVSITINPDPTVLALKSDIGTNIQAFSQFLANLVANSATPTQYNLLFYGANGGINNSTNLTYNVASGALYFNAFLTTTQYVQFASYARVTGTNPYFTPDSLTSSLGNLFGTASGSSSYFSDSIAGDAIIRVRAGQSLRIGNLSPSNTKSALVTSPDGLGFFLENTTNTPLAAASTFNYYENTTSASANVSLGLSGALTSATSGGVSASTIPIRFTRIGNKVTIEIPQFIGTSVAAGTIVVSGIPTRFVPIKTQTLFGQSIINTTPGIASIDITTSGTLIFYADTARNNFANSTPIGLYSGTSHTYFMS